MKISKEYCNLPLAGLITESYCRDFLKDFADGGLPVGRMLGASKSRYVRHNPKGQPYFNGNVFVKNGSYATKVWWGDVDVKLDLEILESISKKLGRTLYIVRESDGRWENFQQPFSQFLKINPLIVVGKREKPQLFEGARRFYNEKWVTGKW